MGNTGGFSAYDVLYKHMDIRKNIKTYHAIAILILVAVFTGAGIFFYAKSLRFEVAEVVKIERKRKIPEKFGKVERPKPAAVSMARLKKQGCVADGLLSEYNPDTEKYIEMVNRSNCYYLHRAVETWLTPPDFQTVDYVMNNITKKDVVYGMFIAEALKTNADYFNEYTKEYFDFKTMCREGSKNVWGEHSCKPTFGSAAYREYLKYITHKAIDLGVQSFMFGQIYMQEGGDNDYAQKIIKDMRDYAKKKGVDIVIGAQTGAITDQDYLSLFDYIEGGVGLHPDGSVEEGACLSWRGGCWALLWHDNYASKADHVLLHLDWTGIKSDDLDVFARMDQQKRAETLRNLYNKFTSQNMGFLMPLFGVLDKENGGCYGPKKRFYSADKAYGCRDENVINKILSGK